MSDGLNMLVAWCGAMPLKGGVILGLFLAGAAGSPMHCAPMCGGFVLGQVADRMASIQPRAFCEWRRVGAAALAPYHLGRITTYAILGAITGLGGGALARLPWLAWVSGLLLLLGAGLFMLQALRRAAPWLGGSSWPVSAGSSWPVSAGGSGLVSAGRSWPASAGWGRMVARCTRGLNRDRPTSGYVLGLALGLLPCGFLYAALIASAASGSPLIGAAGMAAFGLGTVPALVVVGLAGQAAGRRLSRTVAMAGPAVMVFNALMLAGLALRDLV